MKKILYSLVYLSLAVFLAGQIQAAEPNPSSTSAPSAPPTQPPTTPKSKNGVPNSAGTEILPDAEKLPEEPFKEPPYYISPEFRLKVGAYTTGMKTPLRGGYGRYLRETYDRDHLIFTGTTLLIGIRKKMPVNLMFDEYEFLFEKTELATSFKFTDLNGREKQNDFSLSLTTIRTILQSRLFTPEQRFGLSIAAGFNTFVRDIYGFRDTNIVTSNVDENGKKQANSTDSWHFSTAGHYSYSFFDIVELTAEYGFLINIHNISDEDNAPAKNEDNITLNSSINVGGFYYSIGVNGVF